MPPSLAPYQLILIFLPSVLLLGAGIWLLWPALGSRRRRQDLLRTLAQLGPEIRAGIVLDNGLDGLATIDYAVLTPDGIAIIDVLRGEGAIFGAENSDQWVQVIGRRSVRFANPVERNRDKLGAIRFNLPDLPVLGLVLFTGSAEFPKGRPEGVVTSTDLATDNPPTAAPASIKRAWDDFLRLADHNAQLYRNDLEKLSEPQRAGRAALGIMAVLAALIAAAAAAWSLR